MLFPRKLQKNYTELRAFALQSQARFLRFNCAGEISQFFGRRTTNNIASSCRLNLQRVDLSSHRGHLAAESTAKSPASMDPSLDLTIPAPSIVRR
jgi:hypothetical protein